MDWKLLEVYARARQEELYGEHHLQPVSRTAPAGWRKTLARQLIGLGLRLDADASRGAVAASKSAPRLDRSDA